MTYTDIHTHQKYSPIHDIISVLNIDGMQGYATGASYYSLGIHPWDTEGCVSEQWDVLHRRLQDEISIIAVGECGIDRLRGAPMVTQIDIFRRHISLAHHYRMPIIIHCVRAYTEVLSTLREEQVSVPVIFHGFNKSLQLAKDIVHSGYYISLSPSFVRAEHADIIREIPLHQLFLETDDKSIGIASLTHRVSDLLHISALHLTKQLMENFIFVFQNRIKHII